MSGRTGQLSGAAFCCVFADGESCTLSASDGDSSALSEPTETLTRRATANQSTPSAWLSPAPKHSRARDLMNSRSTASCLHLRYVLTSTPCLAAITSWPRRQKPSSSAFNSICSMNLARFCCLVFEITGGSRILSSAAISSFCSREIGSSSCRESASCWRILNPSTCHEFLVGRGIVGQIPYDVDLLPDDPLARRLDAQANAAGLNPDDGDNDVFPDADALEGST